MGMKKMQNAEKKNKTRMKGYLYYALGAR